MYAYNCVLLQTGDLDSHALLRVSLILLLLLHVLHTDCWLYLWWWRL